MAFRSLAANSCEERVNKLAGETEPLSNRERSSAFERTLNSKSRARSEYKAGAEELDSVAGDGLEGAGRGLADGGAPGSDSSSFAALWLELDEEDTEPK